MVLDPILTRLTFQISIYHIFGGNETADAAILNLKKTETISLHGSQPCAPSLCLHSRLKSPLS